MTDKSISIPVIFENKEVIVINKPAGISVHGGNTILDEPTVASLFSKRVEADGTDRAGIVHRLDKQTSGVMIIAKDAMTKDKLQVEFQKRRVEKKYTALVHGIPEHDQANIDLPIGRHAKNPLKKAVRARGRQALSSYTSIKNYRSKDTQREYSLLEVKIATGRTHQIRVHLSHLGHPVVGDKVYGHTDDHLDRLWLHASSIEIALPSIGSREFRSPLPPELKTYLRNL